MLLPNVLHARARVVKVLSRQGTLVASMRSRDRGAREGMNAIDLKHINLSTSVSMSMCYR